MVSSSLVLLAAATASVAAAASTAAVSALPQVTAPGAAGCGGCMLIADIAGVVFGGVLTTTQTNIIVTGRNGTITGTITQPRQTASFISTAVPAQATFVSDAPVPGAATSFNPLAPTITVGGAILTSPTAYEVFTAFSVIRTVDGPDGQCSVSTGSRSELATGIKYTIPANPPSDYLLELESSFINSVGFPSCSPGGGNVATTVHSMITTQTEQLTSTRVGPVPTSTLFMANATGPTASFTMMPVVAGAARPAPALSLWASLAVTGGLAMMWL